MNLSWIGRIADVFPEARKELVRSPAGGTGQ